MKRLCILLLSGLFFLSTGSLPSRADEATKAAKIEQIFELAKLDQILQQTLETSANQVKSGFFQQLMGLQLTAGEQASMELVQQKLQKLLSEGLSWQTLKPAYIKLYADTFSEEDIDGMLQFYHSPAGKAMLEKTPKLMTQANAIVQERLIAMRPQFEALLKEADGLKK